MSEEAAAAAPAAEEPAVDVSAEGEAKTAAGEKILKPVPRPDDEELKKKIDTINDEIAKHQARLTAIKDNLDARDTGRGDSPEVAAIKTRLNEVKGRSRMLQAEKRNIYDQISAADDLKKQQQDLTQRLKAQLTLFSVEQIEAKIRALEHQQQTTSLSVKEDKRIMEDIKRLASHKPMIRQYDEAQESLKGVRDHHAALYVQLKAKAADLSVVKEEEDGVKAQLDAAKSKEEAKRSDVPSLFKERDGLRKAVGERRDEIKKLRDEFNEKRKEWQAYMKQQKEIKHAEYLARKAEREAEYQAQLKAYEEEEAKRDPWEAEKVICEQLIGFCEKYLPKKQEAKAAEAEIAHPDGAKLVKKGEPDDPFASLAKKKSKSKMKGGGAAEASAPAKPKTVRLSHSPDDIVMWGKLELRPPSTSDDCVEMHAQLLAKREWLKTAPPKAKKKAKEEKKDKAEEKEAAAEEKEAAEAAATGDAAAADAAPNGDAAAAPASDVTPKGGSGPLTIKAVSDSSVAIKITASS